MDLVVLFLCSLSLRKEKKNYVSMTDQIPNTKICSSHYGPKWWLNPESVSPICDSTELFELESYSDNQEHQFDKFKGLAICNWYVEDLLDQIYSIQKPPNHSVKKAISWRQNLLYTRLIVPVNQLLKLKSSNVLSMDSLIPSMVSFNITI